MLSKNSAAPPQITICGIGELCTYKSSAVSHVLSILDPQYPDPEDFAAFAPHHRLTLRFHDILEPVLGQIMPQLKHVEELLRFGKDLAGEGGNPLHHLLVHCHMGISRSTASMTTLLAQARPEVDADSIFDEILEIRPQAWPNSRMIAMADDLLGRGGSLTEGLRRLYSIQIRRRPELAEMIADVGRAQEVAMAR